jgi:hypothetical protein
MRLINLTPHRVDLMVAPRGEHRLDDVTHDGIVVCSVCGAWEDEALDVECVVMLPSAGVARVATCTEPTGEMLCGLPVVVEPTGAVTGLPEPSPGTHYVVSRMVADALPERADLVYPTCLARDAEGVIVGCCALGKVRA